MALLTPQVISRTGTTPSFAAATAGGDSFAAGPSTYLQVKNTGSTVTTVTITPPAGGGPLSQTVTPYTQSVGITTGDREFGPFPNYPFAGSDGTCAVTYSQATSVAVAVKVYPG